MPCGLGAFDPSGRFGIPVESENRTVTGIVLPLNSTARLSTAASGDALKLPSTRSPWRDWLGTPDACRTPYSLHRRFDPRWTDPQPEWQQETPIQMQRARPGACAFSLGTSYLQ